MDTHRDTPSISAAEAEAFWTQTEPAYPAGTQAVPADTLQPIDFAGDPARLRPTRVRANAYSAGEVSPALRAFLDGECGGLGMDPLGEAAGEPDAQERVSLEIGPAQVVALDRVARELGFGEPWRAEGNALMIEGEAFFVLTDDEALMLDDLFPKAHRRIAACVNFFEGIGTEEIEIMAARVPAALRFAARNGGAA